MNAPQGKLPLKRKGPFVRDDVTQLLYSQPESLFPIHLLEEMLHHSRDALQNSLSVMLKHRVTVREQVPHSNQYAYKAGPRIKWALQYKGRRYPFHRKNPNVVRSKAPSDNTVALTLSLGGGKTVSVSLAKARSIWIMLNTIFAKGEQ